MGIRETLGQANQKREEGLFLDSLMILDKVILEAEKSDEPGIISEALASRFLTLKHIYRESDLPQYLLLADEAAKAAVEIAKLLELKEYFSVAYFNLAKSFGEVDTTNNWDEAIKACKTAIEFQYKYPLDAHNRPAVVLDMRLHLIYFEMMNSSVTEEKVAEAQSLMSELEDTSEPEYNKAVWLSGSYIRLSQAIKDFDPSLSADFREKGQKIIEANPDLVLRKKQLDKTLK